MKKALKWYLIICIPSSLICIYAISGGVLTSYVRVHIADHERPFQEFHDTAKVYEGSSEVVIKNGSSFMKFQFFGVLEGGTNRCLSILLQEDVLKIGRSRTSFLVKEEEGSPESETDSLLVCLIRKKDNVDEIFRKYSGSGRRFKKCPTILVLVKNEIPPPPQRSPFEFSDLSLWLKKDQDHWDNIGTLNAGSLYWSERSSRTKWVLFDEVDRRSKLKGVKRNLILNQLKALGYIITVPLDFILSPIYIGLFIVLFFTGNIRFF